MRLGYFANLGQGWAWQRLRLFCSGTSQKTYVAVKRHEGEVACAVVVVNTGVFVSKGAKAEHVGNGLIVNIINEGGVGLVAVVLVVVIRNQAWHDRLMDA